MYAGQKKITSINYSLTTRRKLKKYRKKITAKEKLIYHLVKTWSTILLTQYTYIIPT